VIKLNVLRLSLKSDVSSTLFLFLLILDRRKGPLMIAEVTLSEFVCVLCR
jgi:hypothetical protein